MENSGNSTAWIKDINKEIKNGLHRSTVRSLVMYGNEVSYLEAVEGPNLKQS